MDNFERSIKSAGEAYPTVIPDIEQAWISFQRGKTIRKKRIQTTRLLLAAVLAPAMAIAVFLFAEQERLPSGSYAQEVSMELSQTEFYYANLIGMKLRDIDRTGIADTDYFGVFYEQIEDLDRQYAEYKKEIAQFGLQEDLIRAMIENQQRKLRVLEELLAQIQKMKHYERNHPQAEI